MDHDTFSFEEVTVFVRNSGKTPAVKMSGVTSQRLHLFNDNVGDYDSDFEAWKRERDASMKEYERQHPMPPPPPGWNERQAALQASIEKEMFPAGGVMAPGVVSEQNVGAGGSFLERTTDGKRMILYILGKITYFDTVGEKQHTTKYCLMQRGTSFTVCPAGNWMD